MFNEEFNQVIGLSTEMSICMILQILFEPPVLYWIARERFEYKYMNVLYVTVLMVIINPLLGIIAIKASLFPSGAMNRIFSSVLVSSILGLYFMILIIKRGNLVFSTKYWGYALKFNLPLIPHYLSTTVLTSADRIMINQMCDSTKAAIYSIAYAIGMCCMLFSQSIHQTLLPWLYKKIKHEDYSSIPFVFNVLILVMFFLVLFLMCLSPEIIRIVATNEYYEAVWIMPPICSSIFFIFIQNTFANIEYYFEKTKMIATASVLVALLNVGLNYYYIDRYGYEVAGYTTLVCYILYALVHYCVLNYVCTKKSLSLKNIIDIKIIIIMSLIMIIAMTLMSFVYNSTIIRYLIITLILATFIIYKNKIVTTISLFKN